MATLAWKREGAGGEIRASFRGWPAIAVLGAILASPVANALIARSALPEGGVEAVRNGLSLEYRLNRLAGLDPRALTQEESEALGRDLTRLENVELRSVKAKGWLWSRVVRVEVSLDGGPPPDGRDVRYLYLRCGPVIDCLVLDDIAWIRYGLGLWFVEPPAAAFPEVRD